MILGMSVATFTAVHVVISLIGIAAGLLVAGRMLGNRLLGAWNPIFLWFTIATSATGFLFPIVSFTPALAVGALSLAVLAVALWALYREYLIGPWRWIYVSTALLALYLNVFVLVAQGFQKVGPLNKLAPTGTEPPFALAQGIVLVVFIAIGLLALKRFRPVA